MLGKLIAAQMSLEQAISELSRSGASTSEADGQLSLLGALQASIGTASANTLAAIKGEVSAAIARSQSIAQQASEQASAITNDASAALQKAATAARSAVTNTMEFLRHTSLTFASAEDERAYRQREEENRRYIAEQQAKQTPQGDLNASGAAVGQFVDAKAHGAHGPEFDRQWHELVEKTEKLREQVRASGGSTREFDDRLRESIRRTLREKGLSDREIEAQFAAHQNDALEAAKAYVASDKDIGAIGEVAQHAASIDAPKVATAVAPNDVDGLSSALETLKMAGITGGETPSIADNPDHGVTVSQRTSSLVAKR